MPWGRDSRDTHRDTHRDTLYLGDRKGHPRDTKCHGDGDSRDTQRDTPYLGDIRATLGDKRGHQMP